MQVPVTGISLNQTTNAVQSWLSPFSCTALMFSEEGTVKKGEAPTGAVGLRIMANGITLSDLFSPRLLQKHIILWLIIRQ